ncbi:hypothetical protein G6F38_010856 [Rhizopus arrhizus]|nr:hypothetical protein G6F38_010856 [Rhizopus arrhizus]
MRMNSHLNSRAQGHAHYHLAEDVEIVIVDLHLQEEEEEADHLIVKEEAQADTAEVRLQEEPVGVNTVGAHQEENIALNVEEKEEEGHEEMEEVEGEEDGEEDEETKMMKLMGFGGFDTTKNKKVPGADVSGAKIRKAIKYRQYMNRRGGFNRPLDN